MRNFLPLFFICLFLLGAVVAGTDCSVPASNDKGKEVGALRSHPGFRYSEERQQGTSLWLDYRTDLEISYLELNRYAEERSKKLCGGDFRYLSYEAYPDDASELKIASYRSVEIVVECMR